MIIRFLLGAGRMLSPVGHPGPQGILGVTCHSCRILFEYMSWGQSKWFVSRKLLQGSKPTTCWEFNGSLALAYHECDNSTGNMTSVPLDV